MNNNDIILLYIVGSGGLNIIYMYIGWAIYGGVYLHMTNTIITWKRRQRAHSVYSAALMKINVWCTGCVI